MMLRKRFQLRLTSSFHYLAHGGIQGLECEEDNDEEHQIIVHLSCLSNNKYANKKNVKT